MSSMIPIEPYEAEYFHEKSKSWAPCKVIGAFKGDATPVLQFVILVSRYDNQKLLHVETVRLPDQI